MSFPYKNPISSIQLNGTQSVPRNNTYGTTFSVNNTGGYMEVFSLSDLYYTIPTGTTGSIEYSGNTIPIEFTKGTGAAWSPDVITLASDNISSGRRRLGMLAYVYEVDQVYQYHINNYETLFNAATASTGCAQVSDFGTTINNKTAAGQSFINSWTANTIEDVSGTTYSTAVWRKFPARTVRAWGSFISTVSQYVTSTTTAYSMSAATQTSGNGVSVSANTRFIVASAGTYNLQFSSQLESTGGGAAQTMNIWLAINGFNVDNSNTAIVGNSNNGRSVAAWNFVEPLNAGDYMELKFWVSDIRLGFAYDVAQSTPTRPAIPSVIVTVTQV